MKIEISNGELLDRLSILNIKLTKIYDKDKLVNITKEQQYLEKKSKQLLVSENILHLFDVLQYTNLELWNIEDLIRQKEKNKEFDENFIYLARQIYIKNDHRAKIKKQINIISQSRFVEEKSYERY